MSLLLTGAGRSGSGLTPDVWLRADALSLANGAAVTSWPDSGLEGLSAEQGTASAQPSFVTNELNGLPVVRFGAGDFLQTAATDLNLAADLTVLVVTNTAAPSKGLVSKDNQANPGSMYYSIGGTVPVLDRPFVEAGVGASAGGAGWRILAVSVSGTAVSHFLDGAANGTDTLAVGTDGTWPLLIGAFGRVTPANFLLGDVAEVMVFASALATADRRTLEAYLGAKYAITVT